MASTTSADLRRVFAVIDPERFVQPAFERAEWIASRNGSVLHLYCCIGEEDVPADHPTAKFAVERAVRWLERLTTEAKGYELKTEIEVEWNPNWRERIAEASRDADADLIVKTVSRHRGLARQLKTTADWTLLQKANRPVLLIDPMRPPQPKKVIAAVKLNPDSEQYQLLNEQVMSTSHRIAAALGAELHAVTVYKGDQIHFDRQRFADSCGLQRNRVHAYEGTPHREIAEAARELGGDILVIGRASRHLGGSGSIIGATAERIIDAVDTDLVVIPNA
jgi:nucleotide-binding universal stress UspA family protein